MSPEPIRGVLHAALIESRYLPPAICPRRAPAVAEAVERDVVVLTAEQMEMADDMSEAFQ